MALELRALCAGYGQAQILFDVSLRVGDGEAVALFGRNGAGKSTTLKAIAGLLSPWRGEVRFCGERIDRLPSYRIVRAGVGYVPDTRRIFTDLTVAENLEVGRRMARRQQAAWTPERVHALFPNLRDLRDRPGGRISGGEQQMLAIARTLMGNPTLLLLDEPSEGLAPVLVEQLSVALSKLKREGVSMLLCEQNLRFAEGVADRACVLESGYVRFDGTLAQFERDADAKARYLAI